MSYNKRVEWKDRVVERPRTYTAVTNPDGTLTLTPAPGEVIQEGTPQSATNFNQMDEATQHIAIAFDELLCITQAEQRAANDRIAQLEAEVETLAAYHSEE